MAALAAAGLFTLSQLHPLFGPVMAAAAFPLQLLRLRSGGAAGWAALVLSTAVLAAALSPGQGLVYLLVPALPMMLIGESVGRGRGMLRGCTWAFLLLSLQMVLLLLFAQRDMQARALEPLDHSRSPQFLQAMRDSGMPAEQVEQAAEQMNDLRAVMAVVYPGFFIVFAALLVVMNAGLLRLYLAWRDPGWLEVGEFESVRWPLVLPFAFILGGAAVAFEPTRHAAYNVLLVAAFFFGLQGLAVVAFYAHRLAGPTVLRVALMVLVLLNPWAPQILALLGLFDQWIDFRKWAEPPESEAGRPE